MSELLDRRVCLTLKETVKVFQCGINYKEHSKGISELASKK